MDWKKLLKTPAQRRAEQEAQLAEKQRKAEERKAKQAAKKAAAEAKKSTKSPKDLATELGQPWVEIISMELNPDDPGQGAFELDWNDKFVANLVRAGFRGKTDQDIVDNWFQAVCRNVVLETYQQEQADPTNRNSNRRDLGNGRTEIS